MKKVAVVTDSNSGITQAQAVKLGISVIPLPFYIDEQLFEKGRQNHSSSCCRHGFEPKTCSADSGRET